MLFAAVRHLGRFVGGDDVDVGNRIAVAAGDGACEVSEVRLRAERNPADRHHERQCERRSEPSSLHGWPPAEQSRSRPASRVERGNLDSNSARREAAFASSGIGFCNVAAFSGHVKQFHCGGCDTRAHSSRSRPRRSQPALRCRDEGRATVRLFAASFLGPSNQRAYRQLTEDLSRCQPGLLRSVPDGTIHITFAFIPDVDEAGLPVLTAAVQQVSAAHHPVADSSRPSTRPVRWCVASPRVRRPHRGSGVDAKVDGICRRPTRRRDS